MNKTPVTKSELPAIYAALRKELSRYAPCSSALLKQIREALAIGITAFKKNGWA